jgi:hypothetical protein
MKMPDGFNNESAEHAQGLEMAVAVRCDSRRNLKSEFSTPQVSLLNWFRATLANSVESRPTVSKMACRRNHRVNPGVTC